jgi:hypothetical protein
VSNPRHLDRLTATVLLRQIIVLADRARLTDSELAGRLLALAGCAR